MVNKLSQTIIDFNKLDKKNIKTIKIGDEIIGPDENGQVILNGTSGGNNTGGTTGGNTGGGTAPSQVPQLPTTVNLFSGSAVGNIVLSGVTQNFDNIQDGLLITLGNQTLGIKSGSGSDTVGVNLSSIGLQGIKIPKEKLVVNGSFDISDQLSQYIGKAVQGQHYDGQNWKNDLVANNFSIVNFGGTTIKVLPITTLSMNLTVNTKRNGGAEGSYNGLQIPVIQVNTYKN